MPARPEAAFELVVVRTLRTLGYLATSIRRSDGVTIGDVGLPDVLAVHPGTGAFLALELKADPRRHATPAQREWLDAFTKTSDGRFPVVAEVVRPDGQPTGPGEASWSEIAAYAAELAGHRVVRP